MPLCDVAVGQWERCNPALQKACHFPVSGLRGGTSYRFRVCAVNQAGPGRWSKPTAPILTSDPLEASRTTVVQSDRGQILITKDQLEGEVRLPLPPTQLTSCQVSSTYLVLSWSEPDPRGPEPLTYYVERSMGEGGRWERASVGAGVSSPRFPVFDLQRGGQYRFRTRSVNKHGVSEPSEASGPLELAPPPEVTAPPHSLLVFRDSDSSVDLHWEAPPGGQEVLGYYLYYSLTGSGHWNTINNKPISSTRFTAHGLQTQQDYVFRVKAVGRAGTSAYSQQSPPVRVRAAIRAPGPPSGLSLLTCSGSGMVLSWRAPACDGGSPVLGYYLDQRGPDQDPWREVNQRPAETRLHHVSDLAPGASYQFRVCGANLVGLGAPSGPSEAFLCEAWTGEQPGPPYDLQPLQVRSDSLLLRWVPPLYLGASPLIGYQLHVSQDDQSESWAVLNDQPITDTFYQASGLQTGQTYRFRVSAVNQAGVGGASLPTEPITALTPPGTREVEAGVDHEGRVFLSYEVPEATPTDSTHFLWSRKQREAIAAERATLQDRGNRSVLTFMAASQEDLGLYSVELSDRPGLSSSYTLTEAELQRLSQLSLQIRNPRVGLRLGWQVEVTEDGAVRLWLQTEPLSAEAELRLVLNDREIASTPRRRWRLERAGGLVEVLLDPLGAEDQGSYTAQLKDGRSRGQFTLLLVEQRFHQVLAESQANRRNVQKKKGPYFLEGVSWEVTEECGLVIRCKVTNLNKDSSLRWSKDGGPLTPMTFDPSSGVGTLSIPQVTAGSAGSYRAQVADGRGEDTSTLDLLDQEFEKFLQQLSKHCALSAGPLGVQGTAEGLRLYCSLKVYQTHLKTTWSFRGRGLDQDPRARPGSSRDAVWVDLRDPADSDQGRFSLELFDGLDRHARHLDLTGPGFAEALEEHQRMKRAALAERKRAKVTKGLPDAVAIMEGKSLCLTCLVEGDPPPEATWLRNGVPLPESPPYSTAQQGAGRALTITMVTAEDSGTYTVRVLNPHGGETAQVTVSVYGVGETPPANALRVE
ncbi:myomesin-3 [Gadus macrocephalus]|uniref:myomesin-3 n=1 Tax=Gadus macrocephalus TaxID=80720 RepID=UPI0028CB48D6|nr:myomesin-3 [Gadus macrocephalus]